MKRIMFFFLMLPLFVNAQSGIIRTIAGNGSTGFSGDTGPATAAQIFAPTDVAISKTGDIYIADRQNNRIRLRNSLELIFTVAGNGSTSCVGPGPGQPANSANLREPMGVATDNAGNIYIADFSNSVVRKVDVGGVLQEVAGVCGSIGSSGDHGPGNAAKLNGPSDIVVDKFGSIFIADAGNNRIRKVDSNGLITTFAGTGSATSSGDGALATTAGINRPSRLALDNLGNLYLSDADSRIRKINASGIISTVAGSVTTGFAGDGGLATNARLNRPTGIVTDEAGNLYIADTRNQRIRKVLPSGIISTVAGTGAAGFTGDGGSSLTARISYPSGICADTLGNIYFSDSTSRVRQVIFNTERPRFADGHYQTINVCDTFTRSIDYELRISDADMGQTEIWTVLQNPVHGTLAAADTETSMGVIVTPSGRTYNAESGYSGIDSFKVAVGDGHVSDTTTIYVNVQQFPVPGALSGPSVVCAGSFITLTGHDTGGVWTSVNGSTTVALGVVTGVTAGTDTVVYTITNTCGIDSAIAVINVSPALYVDSVTGPSTVCVAASITLTDTSSGGVWSVTNGHASVSSGGVVAGISAGIDTVLYSLTNICGTTVRSATVTILPLPYAGNIAGATTVCEADSITLTDTTGTGTWTISNARATLSSFGSSAVITGVSGGLDTVMYAVTNSCGTAVTVHVITVNPLPHAGIITGRSVVCEGSSDTLTNTLGTGTWSSITGHASVVSSGINCIVTGLTAGIDTIIYTLVTSCGTDFVTQAYTINPLPRAGTIIGSPTVCEASADTLSDTTSLGAITWTISNANATLLSLGAVSVITGVTEGIDTVTYTVTNACGTDSTTQIISINPLPHAGFIAGSGTVCEASTTTLVASASGGAWGIVNTNASLLSLGGSANITGETAGMDTIIYSVSNSCGTDIATFTIAVDPLPHAGTITGVPIVCEASIDTLTDTASSGLWTISNANATLLPLGTSCAITGVTAGIDTVFYTVTNSCGTDIAAQTITINPLPHAAFITGATIVCEAATDTLTDTASSGTWAISNTNATLLSFGTSCEITGARAGLDTVSYTVTNSCGTDIAILTITINPLPHAGTITGTTVVCEASTDTLTDTTSTGTWAISNANASLLSLGTSSVITGVTAGLDTLSYIVTNSCGTDITSQVITINPLPHGGIITGATIVCEASTDTLTDTTSSGTWAISNSNASLLSLGTSSVITGITSGLDTVSYIVTNSCGTDISTQVITINPLPHAGSIAGFSVLCEASTDTLTDTTSTGTWSISNGNANLIPLVTSAAITGVTAGVDTVYYTVINSCGTDVTAKTITINPLPHAGTITGTAIVCEASTDTLTDTTSAGVWSITNANASLTPMTTSCVITGVTAGLDTVVYSVTNSCGTDVTTRVVTINPLPHAGTITGTAIVCEASTDTLTDTASTGTWAISNANATLLASGTTSVITGITAGLDTVYYSVTNSCGTDITSRVITVNPLPHAGVITGGTIVCEASTDTLTDTAATGTWTISNASAALASFGITSVVTGISAGLDTVFYAVTNSCGTDITSRVITINPLPHAGIIAGPATICEASTDTLTHTTSTGTWTISNANATLFPVATSAVITGITPGLDTITYTVTNSCGTDVTTRTFTINPLPHAGVITGSVIVCEASVDTLTDTASGGIWSMSNGNATIVSSATNGILTGLHAGSDTAYYTVTNSCGTDIASLSLTINPLPDAGVITGNSSVCVGSTDILNDTMAGGSWTITNARLSLSPLGTRTYITGISAGIDTVIYSVTNSCGTGLAVRSITVNPLPDAGIITGFDTLCVGVTNTLTDTTASIGTWAASNANASIFGSPGSCIVHAAKPGSDTITYIVANTCGLDTATHIIVINPQPFAGTITGPSSVCVNQFIVLSDSATGGIWSVSNNNASSKADTLTGITAGKDTVLYTVVNSCGTAVARHFVTINPLPVSGTISGPTDVCIGKEVLLAASLPGGNWSAQNRNASVTGGFVLGQYAGTDTIKYTVANSCGIATTVVTVNVDTCYEPPVIKAGEIHVFPSPTHDLVTIETPHSGDYDKYTIIAMDGSIITSGPLLSLKTEVSFKNVASGCYFLRVTGRFGSWSERIVKE